MDSFEKFDDRQLPPKDASYSILTDEGISNEQYEHGKNVWDTLGLKTMGDYDDQYLKSNILLLADVFENFRRACLLPHAAAFPTPVPLLDLARFK